MSSAAGLAITLFIVLGAILYERHQKKTFCLGALERSGFEDTTSQSDGAASGTRHIGHTAFRATITPFEESKAARIELRFPSTPELPALNATPIKTGLNNASNATLGLGDERWSASLHEALYCLGTPTPARFDACTKAFFFDIDAITTTDLDTTIRATVFTTHSSEYSRRVQKMGIRKRITAPQNDDTSRPRIVGDALDALVEFAQALDDATRRHASGPPAAFWRRAWRGTKGRTSRAQALEVLSRVLDEDALWAEVRILRDPNDLETLWRRDPARALDTFDIRERAALLGAPRLHAPELHDALLDELTPDWLDALDWPQTRPVLAILRKKFGIQNLTAPLSRLSRRISDRQRAELVSALGPDAEVFMARGGLSLAEDDSSRGGLSPAGPQGGLSKIE